MHFLQAILACGSLAAASASVQTRQATLEGKSLSILPLGDSITVRIPQIPIQYMKLTTPPVRLRQ